MHFFPGAAALRAGVEKVLKGSGGERADFLGTLYAFSRGAFLFLGRPGGTYGDGAAPLPGPTGPCPGRTHAPIDLIPPFFTYGTAYLFYKSTTWNSYAVP